jgi:hypothetical protein
MLYCLLVHSFLSALVLVRPPDKSSNCSVSVVLRLLITCVCSLLSSCVVAAGCDNPVYPL